MTSNFLSFLAATIAFISLPVFSFFSASAFNAFAASTASVRAWTSFHWRRTSSLTPGSPQAGTLPATSAVFQKRYSSLFGVAKSGGVETSILKSVVGPNISLTTSTRWPVSGLITCDLPKGVSLSCSFDTRPIFCPVMLYFLANAATSSTGFLSSSAFAHSD